MRIQYVQIDEHQLQLAVKLGLNLTGREPELQDEWVETTRKNVLACARSFRHNPFEFSSSSVGPRVTVSFVKVFDQEERKYLKHTVKAVFEVVPEDRPPSTAESWERTNYDIDA